VTSYRILFLPVHEGPGPIDNGPYLIMFECIAGFGLGGSTIALFGRVGGGIYTKAADVGADLAGKVIMDLPEDDAANPGVIADNVGDNVGDIAGMGSDLFGSLAEATCAALVVSGSTADLIQDGAYLYPLMITGAGIIVSIITTMFAVCGCIHIKKFSQVEKMIKWQLIISTVLMIPVLLILAVIMLPPTFTLGGLVVTNYSAFFCSLAGLIGGFLIGIITEYYTSNEYRPVRICAEACVVGAAPSIIQGLALGYMSCVLPILILAVVIFISYTLAGMYGIALAALGMLGCLSIALSIDGYGPISDNAGGIAEMVELSFTRKRTDKLDAAGNTTAAIGKGFAIGSACLVGLALFGAFATRTNITNTVMILQPITFAGLMVGAMLPYAFSAFTMKAVGSAAQSMIEEIQRQDALGWIKAKTPDYDACITISTNASL
jgi:H(+)-translocating pyrophosphatase